MMVKIGACWPVGGEDMSWKRLLELLRRAGKISYTSDGKEREDKGIEILEWVLLSGWQEGSKVIRRDIRESMVSIHRFLPTAED